MSNLGSSELIVLAIILLWLFGTEKLKELARGLGKGAKEFKKIKEDINKEIENNG
jgi:sec-independent protein translocase protein TatA